MMDIFNIIAAEAVDENGCSIDPSGQVGTALVKHKIGDGVPLPSFDLHIFQPRDLNGLSASITLPNGQRISPVKLSSDQISAILNLVLTSEDSHQKKIRGDFDSERLSERPNV